MHTAEIKRLSPIISDRGPLHQKVSEQICHIVHGIPSPGKVSLKEWQQRCIKTVAEGTHLIIVNAFADDKIEIDHLHSIIDILRCTVAQMLKTNSNLFRFCKGHLPCTERKTVKQTNHCFIRRLHTDSKIALLVGQCSRCFLFRSALSDLCKNARKTEPHQTVPVRHGMVKVESAKCRTDSV